MSMTLPAAGEARAPLSPHVEERLRRGEITRRQARAFQEFLARVDRELLRHRIITGNAYTRWFRQGHATDEELRHFVRQFSVFSNQFLVAALLKVINAPTVQGARSGKEILLNELGVIYRKAEAEQSRGASRSDEDKDREGDPELVGIEGSVEGGTYRFRAAHFEWLLGTARCVGLDFEEIGQRKHGTAATLHFCDALQRLYGSEDPSVAEGASFAVENWAAAGFWQEIEDGLLRIKQSRMPNLRIAFFSWHNRVEQQHAGHTMDELEAVFFEPGFDREKFLRGGREVLDAVAVFWDGLEADRHHT